MTQLTLGSGSSGGPVFRLVVQATTAAKTMHLLQVAGAGTISELQLRPHATPATTAARGKQGPATDFN
jgi:hypothetical protein